MDKRIQKTCRNLKQTLTSLLGRKPFEDITVTELCETAATSRITFYSHYEDKYALADEWVNDIVDSAMQDFDALQKQNNPKGDPVAGMENILEAILNLCHLHKNVLKHVNRTESTYLFESLYASATECVQRQFQRLCAHLPDKQDIKRLTAFVCNGMWGFVEECRAQKCSFESIKTEARQLLKSMLSTGAMLRVAPAV